MAPLLFLYWDKVRYSRKTKRAMDILREVQSPQPVDMTTISAKQLET